MWSELLMVAMGSTPRVRARVRKAWTVIKLESGVPIALDKIHFDTSHHGQQGGDNFGEGTERGVEVQPDYPHAEADNPGVPHFPDGVFQDCRAVQMGYATMARGGVCVVRNARNFPRAARLIEFRLLCDAASLSTYRDARTLAARVRTELRVLREPTGSWDTIRLRCEIEDTGCGVDGELSSQIFEPFAASAAVAPSSLRGGTTALFRLDARGW